MRPHEDRNSGRAGVVSRTSRCSVRRIIERMVEGARVPCPSVDLVKCASFQTHRANEIRRGRHPRFPSNISGSDRAKTCCTRHGSDGSPCLSGSDGNSWGCS